MKYKKPYHLHDRTMKFNSQAVSRRQHEYLKLPGTFKALYPQEIIYPDMTNGRADDIHSNTDDTIINLEEERKDVTPETLEKIGRYVLFISYLYSRDVYVAIICHKDPTKYKKSIKLCDALEMHVNYIYFSDKELLKKYENIICKVKQKVELSDNEALDFAFIPKFISEEKGPLISKSLAHYYRDAIIKDKKLKLDVGAILGVYILKHIDDPYEQERLMEEMNMRQIENDISAIVEDEFGDKLNALRRNIDEKEMEIYKKDKEMKNVYQKIKDILNTPNITRKEMIEILSTLIKM